MSLRQEDARSRGLSKPPNLQEKVAQLYYSHGLFCSSYSIPVIVFAVCVGLLCCFPLLNLPLPGNIPKQAWGSNGTLKEPPLFYVQQVVIRTTVLPWDSNLYLGDAFRAPIYEAFKLLDLVRNHQHLEEGLGHVCLHVEAVKKTKEEADNSVFPQYNCLVLSPANLWYQDVQLFAQDSSILTTVFNQENLQKGKTSVAEMLFGMHLSDTGIKRYPMRNRQRILQYAITLFLKEDNKQFLSSLRHKLQTIYPLHQNQTSKNAENSYNDTGYIHYPGEFNYAHFIPIGVAYFLLFLYYYFSVRKMELINSKIGMAFTAVLTVLFSLGMTVGICFFFGLTLSHQGKEMFPYLVVIVGLENVLVLTKSVVSTPTHLDVKIRMAQGLSKEGWFITKNLLIEITILTIGLFTFVPVIQEFCIFAIVGLLSDFFLQMFFFSTFLGIDTRRMENLSVERTHPGYRNLYERNYNSGVGMGRSKSHPRLNSIHTDVVAQAQTVQEKKIPKRLRLVNFWARTRFFQRAFMLIMVIWIARILYASDLLEMSKKNFGSSNSIDKKTFIDLNYYGSKNPTNSNVFVNFVTQRSVDLSYKSNQSDEILRLKHSDYAPWLRLSSYHWAAIMKRYNISLSGKTIAILPTIKISHVIPADQAVLLRNPEDKYGQKFQWQALAAALDPIDFNDLDLQKHPNFSPSERPFYPTTPMEFVLTSILCIISVAVLAYAIMMLYKCICTKNYAEWRASWSSSEKHEESEVPVLLEAVPVVLDGHTQEIECVACDGTNIASACFGGQVKIWNAATGELVITIDRKRYFTPPNKSPEIYDDDAALSDYGSGSPPSRDEPFSSFPSFQHKINTNFSGLKLRRSLPEERFDFGSEYRQICTDHKREVRLRMRNNETDRWVKAQAETKHEYNQEFVEKNVGNVACSNSPIWCMDYLDNLIVIGCSNGRIEVWEGTTGKLKCTYEDPAGIGVTSVKILGSRIVVARLYGSLDFLQLQSYNQGRPIDWNFTCAYRRTHMRTSSAGSISDYKDFQNISLEDIECTRLLSTRAHQQPITCLDVEGGRVLTGSQDHTLKVFRLEDGAPLYTLHGHCGPITCLFIDRVCPATSGSGSQDGMLCVWDLLTGACMYSIEAHDGSITSLTYSASYVISLGSDERLCVWERFQGHLLNTIQISHTFPSHVVMLTPHLIVTSRCGSLVIWDVRSGESVRCIPLGHTPFVFVKQMLLLRDAVLCDFGNQLRIVRFPLITRKFD